MTESTSTPTIDTEKLTENLTPLRAARAALTTAVYDKELPASAFRAEYAKAADIWLREIFEKAVRGKAKNFALVAVGGYGAGELYPESDLDLLLVHRGRRGYQQVAEELWYAIWDTGIRLDHSVRTRKEALGVAGEDFKVLLGLLDGRIIAGEAESATELLSEIPELWRTKVNGFFKGFDRQVQSRHEQFGELAFLLEPDLKQSAGGLRDFAGLHALARALPQLNALAAQPQLAEAHNVIASARVALHLRTNSANDRLLLQEQDQIAELLRYGDADQLMAAIAGAARTIDAASKEAWRRARHELIPSTRLDVATPHQLGGGLVLRGDEVALDPSAPADDPTRMVALATASAQNNLPIEIESIARIAGAISPPATPWSPTLREGFIALLSTGPALIAAVEALDQRHLFEVLMPEWSAVRNRPQRNAYHRFTVDRHLLEAVALCAEHLETVRRPDLLIMGALLHDIGKGFPGDHSEVGKQLAETIGRRMGFNEPDVAVLCDLVSYHLVIPEFATRRDLDDPSTAAVVARLVKTREVLELLGALTEADSRATGSAAWGAWKAELVARLVERVGAVLDGNVQEFSPPKPNADQLELLHTGMLAVRASGHRVTVVAPDRPGLLAIVAGVLALHACNVKRASAAEGVPGMAIEIFDVEPTFEREPEWHLVEQDLGSFLDDPASLEARLVERDATYARSLRPVSATPARAHVSVDNDTSARASIIEVRGRDRLGLLHDIATALAASDLDVTAALVDTLGHEVIDTFYVCNTEGNKLNATEIEQMKAVLERIVSLAA